MLPGFFKMISHKNLDKTNTSISSVNKDKNEQKNSHNCIFYKQEK